MLRSERMRKMIHVLGIGKKSVAQPQSQSHAQKETEFSRVRWYEQGTPITVVAQILGWSASNAV
jgi:hypothetical protein